MKILNLFFVAIMLMVTSCASQLTTLSNGKKIDPRLIGIWMGSESDKQIEGVQKSWEMKRSADGTFVLNFKYTQNGVQNTAVETGTWWIENGKFYERHNESGNTDTYKYKVLNANQIKFSSESISVDMNTDNYEFIDTRKGF